MNETACIDINNAVKFYRRAPVLKELSLQIPRGSVFGLLGVNGAGKTTLIKCVLGLLKMNGGRISVLGDDPWRMSSQTKARIGYVPQSDRIYPWLTVAEVIRYIGSFYRTWNQDLVGRLCREWRIDPAQKYGALSEGEAQKVAIILAMGHEPELFVFDEPVASLDPAARRQFLKTVLETVLDRDCTVFFSTHITSDLERIADHVAVLKGGRIDFNGELGQLKDEVKRLRVVSKAPFDGKLTGDGILYQEVKGNEAYLTVRGFDDQVCRQLEQDHRARVSVEDLNLEEIFLELNR